MTLLEWAGILSVGALAFISMLKGNLHLLKEMTEEPKLLTRVDDGYVVHFDTLDSTVFIGKQSGQVLRHRLYIGILPQNIKLYLSGIGDKIAFNDSFWEGFFEKEMALYNHPQEFVNNIQVLDSEEVDFQIQKVIRLHYNRLK